MGHPSRVEVTQQVKTNCNFVIHGTSASCRKHVIGLFVLLLSPTHPVQVSLVFSVPVGLFLQLIFEII